MNRPSWTLIAALLCMTAGCATTPSPESHDQDSKPYLESKAKQVDEHRYIGAQPSAEDFVILKAAGFNKVVSFRTPPEMDDLGFDEPAILEALGIEYINIPMGGDEYGYTPEQVAALGAAIEPADKVLLHCTIGWRASVVTVAYLIQEEGMPIEEAMTHAQHWWPMQLEKMLDRKLELSFAE